MKDENGERVDDYGDDYGLRSAFALRATAGQGRTFPISLPSIARSATEGPPFSPAPTHVGVAATRLQRCNTAGRSSTEMGRKMGKQAAMSLTPYTDKS